MSQDKDDRLYVKEDGNGTFRLMSGKEKSEEDAIGVVVFVWFAIVAAILIIYGFSPISFFMIVGSFILCILLRNLILIMVGLLFIAGVGYGVIWLFFL
ncbi:hypothetical protein [Oceaniglobus ichthyenteri]|uniref:hypothetical protein n=1 Tax=Oceaniglobus ichthyenteri TaxID=2136177 RepID=UPI000D354902|nr:hypothetical protein [Oceaniglobus ichthyenteri]